MAARKPSRSDLGCDPGPADPAGARARRRAAARAPRARGQTGADPAQVPADGLPAGAGVPRGAPRAHRSQTVRPAGGQVAGVVRLRLPAKRRQKPDRSAGHLRVRAAQGGRPPARTARRGQVTPGRRPGGEGGTERMLGRLHERRPPSSTWCAATKPPINGACTDANT